MRYLRVGATSFGPLHGEELEFGPGLNIVVGPNEARKSSWHAAMYSGLCGRRRGKGRAGQDELSFESRHRPWNRAEWVVRAEIELDDGRAIELRHDLDGRRSDVIDLEFGRPVDDDIMFDGSPDGSRWLGLDRRTFLATACIRQAEILAVAEESEGLKQLLQRAASTLGGEMTAAGAIEALTQFKREHVGRDQTNATRPLRKAKVALVDSIEAHQHTTEAHQQYQQLLAQVDRAAAELEIADHDLLAAVKQAESVAAAQELEELEGLVQLAERVASLGVSPRGDSDLDALRDALAQWSVTVAPRPLVGPAADEIEAAIAAIPSPLVGDAAVDAEVADVSSRLAEARAMLDSLTEPPPAGVVDPELDRAVEIAQVAVAPTPAAPLDVVSEYERLSILRKAHQRQLVLSRGAVRLAATGGLVAIVLALVGTLPIAAVVGGGSALVGLASTLLALSTRTSSADRLAELEHVLSEHERRSVDHVERSHKAQAWLADHDLPADPTEVANIVSARDVGHARYMQWIDRKSERESRASEVAVSLSMLLEAKGFTGTDVDEAMRHYLAYVSLVAENRVARGALPQLEERLRHARSTEVEHAEHRARRESAAAQLIEAVGALGVEVDGGDRAAEAAEELIADQDSLREQARRAEQFDTELMTRLDGRELADVVARIAELECAGTLSSLSRSADPADVERAHSRRNDLRERLAETRGRLAAVEEASVDTAAATARVELARREVTRVEQLGETLDLTCQYLQQAEEEAYRTVAPRLAHEVNQHLGALTGGRYSDARIDPEELTVRVRDENGEMRDADKLSHGTAEQIHLLLRVAMARTLTQPGESCPLLIDDATVHADESRTAAILDLLLELSSERQVVLFSQETIVRTWAETNLDGGAHRLIDLEVA